MEKPELKDKIIKLISKTQLASLATTENGKPWVRYMMISGEPDLTLYATTFSSARKVQQIKENNNVNVIIGGDEKHFKNPHINVQGTAQIVTNLETKQKCWDEHLKQFFTGPEDPDFSVIEISPQVIEYTSGDALKPEIYTVS